MRIVVTGATSFIGLAVIEDLLHGGHEVLAVARPDSPGRKKLEGRKGIRILTCGLDHIGDLADPLALAGRTDGAGGSGAARGRMHGFTWAGKARAAPTARTRSCRPAISVMPWKA